METTCNSKIEKSIETCAIKSVCILGVHQQLTPWDYRVFHQSEQHSLAFGQRMSCYGVQKMFISNGNQMISSREVLIPYANIQKNNMLIMVKCLSRGVQKCSQSRPRNNILHPFGKQFASITCSSIIAGLYKYLTLDQVSQNTNLEHLKHTKSMT